jgi:hypothetical protein
MKVLRIEKLIARGPFALSSVYKKIEAEIRLAIAEVKWPPGSEDFTLNNSGKNCNGVKPIKDSCMSYLEGERWVLERKMRLASRMQPGGVDAVKELKDGRHFAVEWETGNVSSSHRALNKMAIGMIDGCLAGGMLIVPSRSMYYWLTDRIGNYPEIEPYFPIWRSVTSVTDGVLAVVEVEHDGLSTSVPCITKGTDGRALR